MGLLSDAAARTLKYVQDRMQPSYSPPPRRPADGSSANSDASIQNTLDYVSEQPARSRPTTGSPDGRTPTPSSPNHFTASVDTRPKQYQRVSPDADHNTSADAPSVAKAMPYGVSMPGDEQ